MGWQRGLVVACVVAWASACRGGDGGGGGPGGHCPRRLVADRDELPPLLAELSWTSLGPYGPRDRLAITDDLWTTAEIVLEGQNLDVPFDCGVRIDCRSEVRFLMEEPVAGVTLEGPADGEIVWLPDRPILRARLGTSLRLRPVLYDTHPDRYNFVPLVLVLPSCTRACAPGSTRCADDAVCYEEGEASCLSCDRSGPEACACAGLDEGAACDWFSSGDLVTDGSCAQGECVW